MNYKLRTNKAFTLIELVVAVALLAMVLSFAGVIFKVGIESYRTSSANAEIMQKLRAITDQLNRDFQGLIIQPPGQIVLSTGADRADRIAFFANGDFQSVRQYRYTTASGNELLKTVSGNVASIFYGQTSNDSSILARKQKILTSDQSLIGFPALSDPNEFQKGSLAEWRVNPVDPNWTARPGLNPNLEQDLVMYMAKGVGNFTIEQWNGGWLRKPGAIDTKALKFTFTLYDSKGILEEGRTFTHIVYVGD